MKSKFEDDRCALEAQAIETEILFYSIFLAKKDWSTTEAKQLNIASTKVTNEVLPGPKECA